MKLPVLEIHFKIPISYTYEMMMYLKYVPTYLLKSSYFIRRACGHVDMGTRPHQVLATTLTLSQPGGQNMPTPY